MNQSRLKFLIVLIVLATNNPLARSAERRMYQNLDDPTLVRSIHQGNIDAIREAGIRRNPTHKKLLEDVAENFTTNWRKHHDYSGRQTAQQLERLTRNAAKIELSKWGEQKYFDQFVIDLSTTDLQIKIEALEALAIIGNAAAVKHLIKHIDDKSILRLGHDARKGPVSEIAASGIHRIVAPNLDMPELRSGEKYRLYWKEWWQQNKAQYENISFGDGWPKNK